MSNLSRIVILLLASFAFYSQAQIARKEVSGTVFSTSGTSYLNVRIYCSNSSVIYATIIYGTYSSSATLSYYPECAAMLNNNIDDPILLVVSGNSFHSEPHLWQNITVMESEFLPQAWGSNGIDFYPNVPAKLALIPTYFSANSATSYTTFKFTLAVVGLSCGNGHRQVNKDEECEGYGLGCDYDTCTCRSEFYVDTEHPSSPNCMSSPDGDDDDDDDDDDHSVSWLPIFLGIVIPVVVIAIILSSVLRGLYNKGTITCCGVRKPGTDVKEVTEVQPAPVATVVPQQQSDVAQVPYYPQPQQQYPGQQFHFVTQQGHVVPPPQQQQHVMQYPPQQPNVDGQVLPPQQYSQPMMQQQPYAPQPYPDQPTPYGYPGGNAPVQGGYVVYSPPPQSGAFQENK